MATTKKHYKSPLYAGLSILSALMLLSLSTGCATTRKQSLRIRNEQVATRTSYPFYSRPVSRGDFRIGERLFRMYETDDPLFQYTEQTNSRRTVVLVPVEEDEGGPVVIYSPGVCSKRRPFWRGRCETMIEQLQSAGLPTDPLIFSHHTGGGYLPIDTNEKKENPPAVESMVAMTGPSMASVRQALATADPSVLEAYAGASPTLVLGVAAAPDGGATGIAFARPDDAGGWKWGPEKEVADCIVRPPTTAQQIGMRMNYLWSIPFDVIAFPFRVGTVVVIILAGGPG